MLMMVLAPGASAPGALPFGALPFAAVAFAGPASEPPAFGEGMALPGAGDLDARLVPWATLRRLALEAGLQPPVDEPLGAGEWRALVEAIDATSGPALDDPAEREALAGLAGLLSGGSWSGARAMAGYTDRGEAPAGEAGLAWGPGWNGTVELGAQAARGRWWAAVTGRAGVQTGWGAGGDVDDTEDPLLWPGWHPATGPAQERLFLLQEDGARADLVRAVVGVGFGNWALSAGLEPRRDGPGLGGALLMDRSGRSFPALTARRVAPMRWQGVMRPLAPEQLLLRVGLLSRREMADDLADTGTRTDEPWFFQWLVRWRVTDWFRFGCSQTAMAVAREGTLWPDFLEINFPVAGTTWREIEGGPLTDRLFAAQMEFRWVRAPWRWLPNAAGRAWWEYAGTDFLPRGPGGVIPEISAPASVAGIELVSPRWDLGVEYAETLHPLVLWYSNSSFPSAYTNEGWLMGHPLGGAGEQVSALVRLRPQAAGGGWYAECGLARATWGDEGHTPARARRLGGTLTVGGLRRGVPGPWRAHAAWRRTEVFDGDAADRAEGWTVALERRF